MVIFCTPAVVCKVYVREESMKEKRIAFYIGSLNKGGAERVITNLAIAFHEKGYEVFMITKFIAKEEYELPAGITRIIADITKEEEKGRIRNVYLRTKKLRDIILQIHPDVVVSFIGKSNLRTIMATRGTKIPAVVSVRSNPSREVGTGMKKFFTQLLFSMAEGVVLQTQEAKQFFWKNIQKKAIVLQNSINPEFVRESYLGERSKSIVMVGRIDQNKNQRMVIEAFATLAKDYPEWKVELYGDGEERENLEAYVKELSLEKQIIFHGIQTNLPEKIEKASIFVLPSKQEGMPNALIEAMVLGLCVVSTDCPCGGPRDLIIPEKNGILIPVDDKERLQSVLIRLMDDEKLRSELSQSARKIIRQVTPKEINLQWENYLKSVAN